MVKPGHRRADAVAESGQAARYLGTVYRQQYSLRRRDDLRAGEFYWPVERGQKTFNRDYRATAAPAVDGALGHAS